MADQTINSYLETQNILFEFMSDSGMDKEGIFLSEVCEIFPTCDVDDLKKIISIAETSKTPWLIASKDDDPKIRFSIENYEEEEITGNEDYFKPKEQFVEKKVKQQIINKTTPPLTVVAKLFAKKNKIIETTAYKESGLSQSVFDESIKYLVNEKALKKEHFQDEAFEEYILTAIRPKIDEFLNAETTTPERKEKNAIPTALEDEPKSVSMSKTDAAQSKKKVIATDDANDFVDNQIIKLLNNSNKPLSKAKISSAIEGPNDDFGKIVKQRVQDRLELLVEAGAVSTKSTGRGHKFTITGNKSKTKITNKKPVIKNEIKKQEINIETVNTKSTKEDFSLEAKFVSSDTEVVLPNNDMPGYNLGLLLKSAKISDAIDFDSIILAYNSMLKEQERFHELQNSQLQKWKKFGSLVVRELADI